MKTIIKYNIKTHY